MANWKAKYDLSHITLLSDPSYEVSRLVPSSACTDKHYANESTRFTQRSMIYQMKAFNLSNENTQLA